MGDVLEYRVVCVTMWDQRLDHMPIVGKARLETRDGKKMVEFRGRTYPLIAARAGLGGIAITLDIQTNDGRWSLYTDTPAEGRNIQSWEIRQIAKQEYLRNLQSADLEMFYVWEC